MNLDSEVSRRVFLGILGGGLISFLSGCDDQPPRKGTFNRPSYDDYTPQPTPLAAPHILANGQPEPLAAYLRDLNTSALYFINPDYLIGGVNLTRPKAKNFGLLIQDELIGIEPMTTVKATIRAGRGGLQPFALENRYMPGGKWKQVKIVSGTTDHSFLRPDLIPGQPLGGERDREELTSEQMSMLHKYIFRYIQTMRWQTPSWMGPKESPFMINLMGSDEDNRRYSVSVFRSISASLFVEW